MLLIFQDRGAELSEDRAYRYKLWRIWQPEIPPMLFVMLNPSTADENDDDPTVKRCVNYASREGYGGLLIGNLFAYRATFPSRLLKAVDPVGPRNDQALAELQEAAGTTIAAWGGMGDIFGRAQEVCKLLGPMRCLGVTQGGQPKHPVRLRKDELFHPYPPC